MITDELKYSIAKTPGELAAVREFALEECGKTLRSDMPVIVFYDSERKIKGFSVVHTVPVLMSGWSEEISPRQLVEGVRALRNWSKIQYGECIMSNHSDSPVYPFMTKLGLLPTGLELFRST